MFLTRITFRQFFFVYIVYEFVAKLRGSSYRTQKNVFIRLQTAEHLAKYRVACNGCLLFAVV